MTIGQRIKSIRISKGIAQCTLAESIHISPSFMNRIEKGSSVPSIECICSISRALNVTPQELLCDIFVYPADLTVAEEIKTIIEKYPVEKQTLILDILKLLLPYL